MKLLLLLSLTLSLFSCNKLGPSVQEMNLQEIFQTTSSNLKNKSIIKDFKVRNQNWGTQYMISAGNENILKLGGGKTMKLHAIKLIGEDKKSGEKNIALYVEYNDKISTAATILSQLIKTAQPESKTNWQDVIENLIQNSKSNKKGSLPKEFAESNLSGSYSSDDKAITIKLN